MNRHQSLSLYTLLIIITGIAVMLLAFNPTKVIQYMVATGMTLGAVFAFITSAKCKHLKIPSTYHRLHGAGMFAYACAILFFAFDLNKFLLITSSFIVYYGIAETIFCFQLLMLKQKNIIPKVVVIRFILGCFIALGGILILTTSFFNLIDSLLTAGIVLIFIGINLFMFRSVLTRLNDPL